MFDIPLERVSADFSYISIIQYTVTLVIPEWWQTHTNTHTQAQSSYQTRSTDVQGADMQRRPSGPVDRVVLGSGALSHSLLLGCNLGLLGLDALRAVEHHLNHGVLHQRGETKQQASDEPDVDGLDVGHFGQFLSQGGALRGQREHREDAYTKKGDN